MTPVVAAEQPDSGTVVARRIDMDESLNAFRQGADLVLAVNPINP